MKINTGISLSALATASLVAAAPAAAQDATVIQADEETEQNSTAAIEQDGRNNDANGEFDTSSVTLFDGTQVDLAPNGSGIYQDGSGSTARIEQFGDYNTAGINQADSVGGGADSSTAVILQGESGNRARYSTAYIDQQGDASTVRIEQNGSYNDSFAFQRGNLDGSQTGNIQTQIIDGDRNRTEIVQTMGIANEAGITLSTDRNDAFILQDADTVTSLRSTSLAATATKSRFVRRDRAKATMLMSILTDAATKARSRKAARAASTRPR